MEATNLRLSLKGVGEAAVEPKFLLKLLLSGSSNIVLLDIFGTTISSLKLVLPGFQVYNNGSSRNRVGQFISP
jgi:hypothetical protein